MSGIEEDGQGLGFEASECVFVPQVPEGWNFQCDAGPNESGPIKPLTPNQQAFEDSQTQLINTDSETIPGGVGDAAGADSSAAVVPATSETPRKKSSIGPGEQHAINKYAEKKGIDPNAVTVEMVADSPEKLMYWATLDIDWNARSAASQRFYKSQRTQALDKDRDIYINLDEPLKKEYRQSWNLKRDYDFTRETKIITMTYQKECIDAGKYRTEEQIAVELGLAGYPHPGPQREKILKMANDYVTRCKIFGGRWLLQNQWLQEDMFLWMEKMVNSSCRKSWSMVAENSSEVNVWEEKAKQCKARRALALSRNTTIDSVSLQDVIQSPGGLDYWASVSISIDASSTATKPKPKGKAKAKAEAGSGTKTLATIEKNLKALVAQEMLVKKGTDQLKESQTGNPEHWTWAHNLFNQCAEYEAKVTEIKGSGFIAKFIAAALSPETLKKLKKETGDDYHNEVLRCLDALKQPLEEWSQTVGKMQAMADAAGHGEHKALDAPKKRPRKSK